ncbi:MAG: hypothetical protein AMXMBFR83_05230 [Phycisphaerae bacterium]|jgi:small subunit ribosomal protein S16
MKRTGRTHTATYRVTVVDSRATRDGRVIEELGYYDPANRNPDLRLKLNLDRVQHWIGVGAQPSDTVRTLLKRLKKTQAPAQ